MTKSKYNRWLKTSDSTNLVFRKIGKQYDILEFQRYEYTPSNINIVSALIKEQLTTDLISSAVKKKYPSNHKRWNYPYFGCCVPATFSLLYLMNTDKLESVRGEDYSGEGHYWLRDIDTKKIYDLTLEQFSTSEELEDIYASGKSKVYYGYNEMPASRFLKLIQKVQPESIRWRSNTEPNL